MTTRVYPIFRIIKDLFSLKYVNMISDNAFELPLWYIQLKINEFVLFVCHIAKGNENN